MSMNRNTFVDTMTRAYMMQPGDATCYRFSITQTPRLPEEAYIIDAGVSQRPESYVQVAINMPGGTGIATLLISSLIDLSYSSGADYVLGYAASHGLGNVNSYTLAAVLLACQVLIDNTGDLERAAANMLRAPELLSR